MSPSVHLTRELRVVSIPMGRYKYTRRKSHPLLPEGGGLPQHRISLYDAIGPGPHPCHWCDRPLEWLRGRTAEGCLVVDHLDNDGRNNALENLVPSCHSCNLKRRHDARFADELFVVIDGKRHRALERVCVVCGETFLKRAAIVRNNPTKGQYCSQDCLRTVKPWLARK